MTSGKNNMPQKPTLKAGEKIAARAAAKKAVAAKKVAKKQAGHPGLSPHDIKKYTDEIKTLNDRALRAMAEAENTRRRAQREIEDTRAYSITGFAREMLTVQDNLRRALAHLPEDMKENEAYKAFIEGVEVTERELLNIFDRHGIKLVHPKGEAYDHNLHQAIFEVETDEAAPGTIVQVIQEGYVLRDRLLRPAMVGVAKAPAAPDKKPGEDAKKEG